jgi:hypothetical protein
MATRHERVITSKQWGYYEGTLSFNANTNLTQVQGVSPLGNEDFTALRVRGELAIQAHSGNGYGLVEIAVRSGGSVHEMLSPWELVFAQADTDRVIPFDFKSMRKWNSISSADAVAIQVSGTGADVGSIRIVLGVLWGRK